MTITLQQLALFFVALFTLFSPLSNVGPYSSLMSHLTRADQKKLAFAVGMNVAVVTVLFVWAGELLFKILGVNTPSLTIAGGIALIIAGLPMMLGTNRLNEAGSDEPAKSWREMSVLPMTFPMSMGGTTVGYVVTAAGYAKNLGDLVAISVVCILFAFVVLCTIYLSPPVASRLPPQAQLVLGRVSGIVLVAISIQLFASGLKGLFPVLAGS